jgi:formate hydrogenlyase subunit 3/multisubunit Na+/H+ antiporter MnhD subunit
MSAAVIWIIFPAALGLLLFALRYLRRWTRYLGIFAAAWLAFLAALVPIGEVFLLGASSVQIRASFSILGRELLLTNGDRPLLFLVYLFLALWVFGSGYSRANIGFIPFSFAFTALLVAALAVEPFLYAALLIELCVLLAIPFLSPPSQRPGRGIYRFLTLLSLGMPFILLAGWFLAGLEVSPGQSDLVLRAGVMIGIGLAFLLSIVPFHSWIPTLAGESEPYVSAFVLFTLPSMVAIFGLGFLDRFVWLREAEAVYQGLRFVSVLMIGVGGLWAAVETHLGRMIGHTAIAEIGIGLLAVGLGSREGLLLFFWLLVVRMLAVIPWAVAISRLWGQHKGDISLDRLRGQGHQLPLYSGMVVIGLMSLAGVPMLASFSVRFSLWRSLSGLDPAAAALGLVGNIGLMVGALRVLYALFIPLAVAQAPEDDLDVLAERVQTRQDNLFDWVMYFGLLIFLTLVGYLPGVYLPWIERLLTMFERLGT